MSATENNVNLVLSAEDQETVNDALAILLGVVRSKGTYLLPGKVEECSMAQLIETGERAVSCLKETRKSAGREILRAAKPHVDNAINQARKAAFVVYRAELDAYKGIAEILMKTTEPTANAMLREVLGKRAESPKPPTACYVPVSAVKGYFPADLNEEQIVSKLHDMNVKLAKGRSEDGKQRIRADITEEHVKAFQASLAAE